MIDFLSGRAWLPLVFAVVFSGVGGAARAAVDLLPGIVLGPSNAVPPCVTPSRLMEYVKRRDRGLNPPRQIDPRFSEVASIYKSLGECVEKVAGKCVGLRWDFAFYQMLIETNYLLFSGAVTADDNNFAGIGASVPGKSGERFDTVQEGILAHLQHVLMYGGVSIQEPIYKRTKIIEADIRETIGDLGRPVSFSDLAKIWTGTEPETYAVSIRQVSNKFDSEFCKN